MVFEVGPDGHGVALAKGELFGELVYELGCGHVRMIDAGLVHQLLQLFRRFAGLGPDGVDVSLEGHEEPPLFLTLYEL